MINLYTPINSLGYGVVGYNLWKELNDITDVTLWPMAGSNSLELPVANNPDIVNRIKEDLDKRYSPNGMAPCLKVWHENSLLERIGIGPYFALPFFEINKFDKERKLNILSTDGIIVCSQWAKNIVEQETKHSNVHVVPCGVDTEIFQCNITNRSSEKCVFFNCGKWEIRKGHDILGQAFKDAFQGNEDVELWMMCDNPFFNESQTASFTSKYQDHRIKLISRVPNQESLANIMSQTYCGVFPSRAEGWNLEALEMMACGNEVIITDYSAHTEFCDNDNSLLVCINKEEPAYDGHFFKGDKGTWASFEGEAYDTLVLYLRNIYKQWQEEPFLINDAGIETANRLSWKAMASNIIGIINERV